MNRMISGLVAAFNKSCGVVCIQNLASMEKFLFHQSGLTIM